MTTNASAGIQGLPSRGYPTLEEVVEFFAGKRKLENVLHQNIQFEPASRKQWISEGSMGKPRRRGRRSMPPREGTTC